MPDITVTWTLSEADYRRIQAFVKAQGQPDDTVEAYAARVGLKGLRGALEALSAEARRATIGVLVRAYDGADEDTKTAALDALGFARDDDGQVTPKKR